MPKSKLPERWEKYSNVGEVIPGTRLITFKVPLNENLCSKYEDDSLWFTPDTLLETTAERGVDLGLVIDLTFTSRYYHHSRLTNKGVLYEKIFVPGHVIPDNDIVDRFFTVIDTFLEDNKDNDKVIGIHCTHGVNRTGYVVCRYMIERLGIKPAEAIEAYGKARGYPIERENYLEDLKLRPRESEEDDVADKPSSSKNNKDWRNSGADSKNWRNSGADSKNWRNGGAENKNWRNSGAENKDWRNSGGLNGYQNGFCDRTTGDGNHLPYRNQGRWDRNHFQEDGSGQYWVNHRTRQSDNQCSETNNRPYQQGAQGWSNYNTNCHHSGYRNYPPHRHWENSCVNRNFNSYNRSNGRHNQSHFNPDHSSHGGKQYDRNRYKWSKKDNLESEHSQPGASCDR